MIEGLLRYMFMMVGLTEYIKSQLGRVETTANDNTYCLSAYDRTDRLIGKICVSTEDEYIRSKIAFFINLIAEEIKKEKNK